MKRADVVVVGGGVIGASVAYFLARQRLQVLLLERDDFAAQASGAAAGMLAPIAEARVDQPFLRWGLRSLAQFPPLCAELAERTGIDPEFVEAGVLRVAREPRAARALEEQWRCLRTLTEVLHCELEWLSADAVLNHEPQLVHDVIGGLWSPREAHVRPRRFVEALLRAALLWGVRLERGVAAVGILQDGERVAGVRTTAGSCAAAHVVLCTGAWARDVEQWLPGRVHLPISPVRGQIVLLQPLDLSLHSTLWEERVYLVPKRDGRIVVGATQEDVGFDRRVTAGGVRDLLAAATAVVPGLARAAFSHAWAGLRPTAPDARPVVGPVPGVPGLCVAVGHFRNGILLAPVTAATVADYVLGKGVDAEAGAFLPDRFAHLVPDSLS